MAKRFIDTDLFRKPFMRSLEAPYKALWIYLLCELDPDYFAAGKKRLEQHQLQPRLFEPEAQPNGEQLTIDPAA